MGELNQTKAIEFQDRCPPGSGAATLANAVQIRRSGRAQPDTVKTLQLDDGVFVDRRSGARVRVQYTGPGTFYLVPSLLCRTDKARGVVAGLRVRQGHRAEYEVFLDTTRVRGQRQDRLAISVERGALIVDWLGSGPLRVLALGSVITIGGTRLAVVVDSMQQEGLAYLEHGDATLNTLPGGRMQPGQLLHLRRGLPPEVVDPELAPVVEQGIQYHAERFWQRPFLVRNAPWLVPGAALGGYGIYRLAKAIWPHSGNTRTGTVVVQLPF